MQQTQLRTRKLGSTGKLDAAWLNERLQRLIDSDPNADDALAWNVQALHLGDMSAIAAFTLARHTNDARES